MPDPMLGNDRLVAARQSVAAQVVHLQVRGGNGQHVPVPFGSRETLPGMRRIVGRMGPVIDINSSFVVVGQRVAVEGQRALRARIDVAPNAQVTQAAKSVVGRVWAALIL